MWGLHACACTAHLFPDVQLDSHSRSHTDSSHIASFANPSQSNSRLSYRRLFGSPWRRPPNAQFSHWMRRFTGGYRRCRYWVATDDGAAVAAYGGAPGWE